MFGCIVSGAQTYHFPSKICVWGLYIANVWYVSNTKLSIVFLKFFHIFQTWKIYRSIQVFMGSLKTLVWFGFVFVRMPNMYRWEKVFILYLCHDWCELEIAHCSRRAPVLPQSHTLLCTNFIHVCNFFLKIECKTSVPLGFFPYSYFPNFFAVLMAFVQIDAYQAFNAHFTIHKRRAIFHRKKIVETVTDSGYFIYYIL